MHRTVFFQEQKWPRFGLRDFDTFLNTRLASIKPELLVVIEGYAFLKDIRYILINNGRISRLKITGLKRRLKSLKRLAISAKLICV
ncbi:hypothetical protein GJ744_007920, partial [Endocarpon pusillum]